jgi:hypothetical protein
VHYIACRSPEDVCKVQEAADPAEIGKANRAGLQPKHAYTCALSRTAARKTTNTNR